MKENARIFAVTYGRYILVFIAILLIVYALLCLIYENVKGEMIDALNERQKIHARQAARGIENFFHGYVANLQNMARNGHVVSLDTAGKEIMRNLQAVNEDEISIVARIDKNGMIVHPEPFDPAVIRKPVTGMEDFREVRRTGLPAVSDVFTNRRGLKTIILHVPVFKEGAFDGSLAVILPFDTITRRYVADISIGRDGYAWVISKSGVELACPVPGHVGNSVFDNCRKYPDIVAMAERMARGEHGVTTYRFDRIRGAVVNTTKHAVFMPVRLGNTFWSIVVATPEDELLGSLVGFRNRLVLIAALFAFGVAYLFIVMFKNRIMAEDVARRRITEDALRESEEVFRLLFEKSDDANLLIDGERYIDCNEAALRIAGCSDKAELLNAAPGEISPERQPDGELSTEKAKRMIAVALREGSHRFEWVCRRFDGTVRHLDVMLTPIVVKGRNLIYTTWHDITEKNKAEEELRESRRRLEDIIEFLPDATLVIDREGRVIAWNRAMEAMTGVKKEDMLGRGDYAYALPFYGEKRPILIDLALSPDKEREKDYTAVQRREDILHGEAFTPNLPSGNVHLSATASVLRDSKDEIIAAIECVRDNTERRRLEERLNRAEKMEGLGRLAGGVAHDMNNVLGVLAGYAELLADKLPAKTTLRTYADNILQSSVRGAAIIQDLLTLARRGVAVAEVVNLNEVVLDYLKTLEFERLESDYPGVTIRTDLAQGLLNSKGSPVHLSKIVMNLVINAAEAIAGRGEITIRTENRHLDRPIRGYDEMQEGDYVVLAVSDTGSGIPAGDLGNIFEPFYTKKVMGRSGTGLGLAVVWGTVKDHDGYIDVRSEEGRGSAFTVFIPVCREEQARRADAVSPDAYRGKGEAILVVDDMHEQRGLAADMLTRLGYAAAAVAGGEEAIAYLDDNEADLLVLDMIMEPGIDGLDTYRRILARNPRQKAVIVSGFAETDRVKEAQRLGAGAFVRKPYILERIGLAIRKELDRPD